MNQHSFSVARVTRLFRVGVIVAFALSVGAAAAQSADGAKSAAKAKPEPSAAEVSEIITKFAAKEAQFRKARENYTYRQSIKMQEYEGGAPAGKYELISDIIFDQGNKRNEVIVKAPMTTLRQVSISPEDEKDLRDVLPFVLTTDEIGNYQVNYLGRSNADEIPCYLFSVKPRKLEKGLRYFQGLIWVDDEDLQIVKTYGRSTGILAKGNDQAFPKFETFRDQVDGKFWFPVFSLGEDTLQFENGQNVPIKVVVKYENYKAFGVDVTITLEDEAVTKKKSTESEAAKPPAIGAPKKKP